MAYQSFGSDLLRMAGRYLLVGGCFVPWGLGYAIAERYGWDITPVLLGTLAGGLVTSGIVWARLAPAIASARRLGEGPSMTADVEFDAGDRPSLRLAKSPWVSSGTESMGEHPRQSTKQVGGPYINLSPRIQFDLARQ